MVFRSDSFLGGAWMITIAEWNNLQCVARQLLDGLDASDALAEGPRVHSSGDVACGDIRCDRREPASVTVWAA